MTHVALVANPAKVANLEAVSVVLGERLTAAGWPAPMILLTSEEDPGRGCTEEGLRGGAGVVIAAGGDGTVAAVASVLSGTDACPEKTKPIQASLALELRGRHLQRRA